MTLLTSRRHPWVTRCRELAAGKQEQSNDPAAHSQVLLDGPHLLREALASDVPLDFALADTRILEKESGRSLADTLASRGIPFQECAGSVIEAASPVRTPAGVVAIARLAPADPDSLLRHPTNQLVVAAGGVQDPGNLGAIVRVAEAAGAAAVISTSGSADPLSWKALRASAGSALRLPVARHIEASELCVLAQSHGWRILATDPADGMPHDQVDYPGPSLLLLGGEGPGLDPALIAQADQRLRIDMQSPVESLNVAVAAGIILFEARRQLAARSNNASSQSRTSG